MLPCTYLNSDDMILGSGNKITDGLSSVSTVTDRDIVLIDTLGATIQVTDRDLAVSRAGADGRVLLADEDLSSVSMAEGYDMTLREILRRKDGWNGGKGPVAILGYTMADSSWMFGKKNITELLALCDVHDAVFLGCDGDPAATEAAKGCSFAISLHPEMTALTSQELKYHGIDTLIPECGSPIGYDSMRSFVTEVSEMAGTSPDRAVSAINREENAVKRILINNDKDVRVLRGQLMTVEGIPSDILPLMEWLYDLFLLVPGSVRNRFCSESPYQDRIDTFLEGIGCGNAYSDVTDELYTFALFCDGLSAELYKEDHPTASCVPISMPYAKKAELVDRSLVGFGGARNILDTLINGIGRFSCGQPTMADFR